MNSEAENESICSGDGFFERLHRLLALHSVGFDFRIAQVARLSLHSLLKARSHLASDQIEQIVWDVLNVDFKHQVVLCSHLIDASTWILRSSFEGVFSGGNKEPIVFVLSEQCVRAQVHAVEAFAQILSFAEEFEPAEELIEVADRKCKHTHRETSTAEFYKASDWTGSIQATGVTIDCTGNEPTLGTGTRDTHHVSNIGQETIQGCDCQGHHIGAFGTSGLKSRNFENLGVLAIDAMGR